MPDESKYLIEAEASELLVYDTHTRTHVAGSEQAYQNFIEKYPNLDRHTFLGSIATTVELHIHEFHKNVYHNPALRITIKVLRYTPDVRRVYVCSMIEYQKMRPKDFELMDTYMHFSHVIYPSQDTPDAPLFN